MINLHRIWALLKKDILLEFRNFYAIGGLLLYVVTTVFIVYKMFSSLESRIWNSLFWVLFAFAAVNVTLRSFTSTNQNNRYFQYSFTNPTEFLVAKIIYNFIFLLLIAGLTFLAMGLFFPHPIRDFGLFAHGVCLASIGISIVYSFSSALSIQGTSNSTLMTVLSMPLSLPILLISLKISAQAMGLISDSSISSDFVILYAIILIMFSVSVLLFPYLWKS